MRQKIIVNPILRRQQGEKRAPRIKSYKNRKLQNKIKELSKKGLRPNSPSTLGQISMLIGLGLEIEIAAKLTKKQAKIAINQLKDKYYVEINKSSKNL